MTLVAFLERLSPEELVYLGTNKGSNFIVVDTAENIIKDIDIINDVMLEELNRHYNRNIHELSKLPRATVEIQEKLEASTHSDDIDKWTKKFDLYIDKIVTAYNGRNNYAVTLRTWIPYKEREVVESYPHTAYEHGTVVLVKGKENGKYWSKQECDLDKLRKNLK